MGKKRTPILTESQLIELNHGYRHGTSHFYRQRCHLVLLKHQGYTALDISRLEGYPQQQLTINNWVSRYESKGLLGLMNERGQGRKTIINKEQHGEAVKSIIQSERQRLTYAKSLIEKEIGVSMSKSTLVRFLKVVAASTNA
jgi:transposase